ncbi:unnamed protein product, partial [Brenthis ino]
MASSSLIFFVTTIMMIQCSLRNEVADNYAVEANDAVETQNLYNLKRQSDLLANVEDHNTRGVPLKQYRRKKGYIFPGRPWRPYYKLLTFKKDPKKVVIPSLIAVY